MMILNCNSLFSWIVQHCDLLCEYSG